MSTTRVNTFEQFVNLVGDLVAKTKKEKLYTMLMDNRAEFKKPVEMKEKPVETKKSAAEVRSEQWKKNKETREKVLVATLEYHLGIGSTRVHGVSWYKTREKELNMANFNAGVCEWLGLLEQNPEKDSWSAELVRNGWKIYWILKYAVTKDGGNTIPCGKCYGTGQYYSGEGSTDTRKCFTCKGKGHKLHTKLTQWVLAMDPITKRVRMFEAKDLFKLMFPDGREKNEEVQWEG
jgi:hypothetical protein